MAEVYLKAWRISRGISVRGLVNKSGVSLASIVQIEGGHRPNPGILTIEKLAVALDIEFFDIFSPPPKGAGKSKRKRK
ncbi:MAG: helix-turn-helix transcriptional regulator [Nitrospinaceae bacterium]|jgi:transcriptional regulator with XRE-family HTH domain|nr:helix-turn-helix transcriptional regulator [Nitrospinaceae bacterium]